MKIIVAATTEPITIEQARKQCKVDAEGFPLAHEDDELIMMFVTAAREWAEVYLGRPVAETTVETAFDSFPSGSLTLEGGPVVSVEQITYIDADGFEQIMDDDGTIFELDNTDQIPVLKLKPEKVWPVAQTGTNVVKVQYVIGYSRDQPLPKSVSIAILLVLGHLYQNRENTVEKNLTEIPMGARFFLSPFMLRRRFA